jgi:hypothetical protein
MMFIRPVEGDHTMGTGAMLNDNAEGWARLAKCGLQGIVMQQAQ